jgi:hypothetical protein
MMPKLGQFIVHLADLIEAEGRLAKQGAFRLAMAIAFIVAAALLMVAAVLTLGAAAFLGLLAAGLHPAMACLVLGLALLIVGLIGALVARSLGASRR